MLHLRHNYADRGKQCNLCLRELDFPNELYKSSQDV